LHEKSAVLPHSAFFVFFIFLPTALPQFLGERFRALQDWSLYLITAFPDAEKCIGRKADKNRKIYNGMMKTYFYQFLGKKPPKREKRQEKQGE